MPTKKVWGYDIRDPYDSENYYFQKNRNVSGMAADDGRIVLNPFSKLQPHEFDAVAKNEAARLYMREKKFKFDFDPTPEQMQSFSGTAYENDQDNMKATILARALSGDPSAGPLTKRQKEWVDWLLPQLDGR
jgi:hypothetical protein